jgi:hypothetical protein
MTARERLSILLATGLLMAGVAGGCGDDASVEPGERGDSPSAVGEPGNEESETGGGGTPAEGVDDQNDEN